MIILLKGLNEEFSVKRCVSHFHDQPFCTRVIVIDGGSTDYTVEELKQFSKVQVFVHPWLDWYHDMEIIQSNIALSYVPNGEWCFILDFDEHCNESLIERLNKFQSDLDQGICSYSADAINIARKTFDVMREDDDSNFAVLGNDGWPLKSHAIGQFPDYQCRLIKRSYKYHWVNSPHHVLWGCEEQINFDPESYIVHYEKDDKRQRTRIEKKWLRAQLQRKKLGLSHDLFECEIKPELTEFINNNYWR